MPKIKIVQIALSHDKNHVDRYLDDRGRVWYKTGYWSNPYPETRHWVTEWKQIKLPDEPEEDKTDE